MAGRVLIVDDEPGIRHVLHTYLSADGFDVVETGSGRQALALLGDLEAGQLQVGKPDAVDPQGESPDLVLLDVGLPDLDGVEVLRRIRVFSDVFVILVTARSEEVDKLVGLTLGADDYITKPFSPREVVARVKTVLRRSGVRRSGAGTTLTVPDGERRPIEASPGLAEGTSTGEPTRASTGLDDVHRYPGLSIDPLRRQVLLDGRSVAFSALEFDLLLALAGGSGRVFSRTQLLERVWGYDFYGDERVVDVHIRSIRRLLGDDATAPRFIGTVRGVGYRFLPDPL